MGATTRTGTEYKTTATKMKTTMASKLLKLGEAAKRAVPGRRDWDLLYEGREMDIVRGVGHP